MAKMESAPRNGIVVLLLIPYKPEPEWDYGYWSEYKQCFRFNGDDGPNDIQPVEWMSLNNALAIFHNRR